MPEGIAVFHPRPHKQPPEHVRKKDFRMMEPILGQIALLPQLNETEELRPDLIHFAGEVHRRLLKDRFRDQRLGGDARVPADGGVGRAVHQRDVAAHVFDVEEHLLLGKDLRQMAVAGGERQISLVKIKETKASSASRGTETSTGKRLMPSCRFRFGSAFREGLQYMNALNKC